MKRILIVDDDIAVTNYFMVFLMQTGLFDTTVVNDSRKVTGILEKETFDIILLDMDMPNVTGMNILYDMRGRGDNTPVVILTGVSDVDLAVRAMKQGAFDYLIKPVDDDYLLEVLNNALEHGALIHTIDQLSTQLKMEDLAHIAAFEQFPTRDPGIIHLFHQAERMASSDLSVFIWGENGTGKEALARAIHRSSPRAEEPFLAIEADSEDSGSFPPFFFGQARDYSGAREESPGILEEAGKGTIFLDNIERLSLPVQVRLKRVIQTGEYYRESSAQIRNTSVRFIVASTCDLTLPEYKTSFSRDLLYHLMVNSIRIPPLRERADDIPVLAEHFLSEEVRRTGRHIIGFSEEFLNLLKGYSFPDNVQELRTIIAGAVANEESDHLNVGSLSPYMVERLGALEPSFEPRILSDVVSEQVLRTIEYYRGDMNRTANELGISVEELDRLSEDL
jgi:DNA-binding NtrC family response regulator